MSTWGIIPAAGNGTRIQPLAFSKELLPVGSRRDARGVERPRAVSEYLIERMTKAGATRICVVISPGKTDILNYFGGRVDGADIAYAIQDEPHGLCDAIFRAAPLIPEDDDVIVGLPDTIWFPVHGLAMLPADRLGFLLFPVATPELFDAVLLDEAGAVARIEVKAAAPRTDWVWGAFRMPGWLFHRLHALWLRRDRTDVYIGTLVNAWIAAGGTALGVRGGESYVDVGTLGGYRSALALLTPAEAARAGA